MLSQHENDLLTRVGAGTAMGELMRRYWIPAAFSQQIATPDSAPMRVRLMGENLVLFRDTHGRIGLIDERCPHRTASMFFGRNEEGGCAASIMASSSTLTAIASISLASRRRARCRSATS